MWTIAPLLTDGALLIDNSSMEYIEKCMRSAQYHNINKRELDKSRSALEFGKAFHEILASRYRDYGNEYLSKEQVVKLYQQAAASQLSPPDDDYRTASFLCDAVLQYCTQYPAESFQILLVEQPFAFRLGSITIDGVSIPIIWQGRLDLLYRSNGRVGIMDHKTTSMMGPQFFSEFAISHQMYGYRRAGNELLKGTDTVKEFTINGLGCRQPTKTGKKFEFLRHINPVDESLAAEWETDCLNIVASFLTCCRDGYFSKITTSCVGKYGACQYHGVCTMPTHVRDNVLASNEFRPVTWDPLA
jgi:hypothetical protein